jgi:hypothetical protein
MYLYLEIIQFHSRTLCLEKEDETEGTRDSGGKKKEGGGREGGGGGSVDRCGPPPYRLTGIRERGEGAGERCADQLATAERLTATHLLFITIRPAWLTRSK